MGNFIPPDLINVLIQGGFAALFIWLLLRTQDRQDKREDALIKTLDGYANTLPNIVKSQDDLMRLMVSVDKRLEMLEKDQRQK